MLTHQLEHEIPRSTVLAFSPDGHLLAAGTEDGAVCLVEIATRGLVARLSAHAGAVVSLAFSPDGCRLASGGVDGSARLWDVESSEQVAARDGAADVGAMAYSHDGQRIGVACRIDEQFGPTAQQAGRGQYTHGLLMLSARDLEPQWGILAHRGRATGVAFAPDGQRVVSSGLDGLAVAYDPGNGKVTRRHDLCAPLHGACYRPDGKRLYLPAGLPIRSGATSSALEQRPLPVMVLNGLTLDSQSPLAGHSGPPTGAVRCFACAASGSVLASGGSDGAARLWDPASGAGRGAFTEHTGGVRSVALSPDGFWFASCGDDGRLVLRDFRPPTVPVQAAAPARKSGCAMLLLPLWVVWAAPARLLAR